MFLIFNALSQIESNGHWEFKKRPAKDKVLPIELPQEGRARQGAA